MSYTVTWADQKINKNEKAKLKKDGLDVFDDLPELVKHPFADVDKSYYMYFKYAGLTPQKPQKDGKFMVRIKIPGGVINLTQAKMLAHVAQTFGEDILNLTTRQGINLHNVMFADLPDLFAQLNSVGLTTQGAEGDITRNIVDNPLSGIDKDELFDTRPTVLEVQRRLQGNRDYSNLPRKMKVSISSSIHNAGNAEINDLGFLPATKEIHGKTLKGFNVKIGGGLGALPFLGLAMNIFVTPEQVPDLTETVIGLYRDYGYRGNRGHARLKFLIQDWGVAKFEAKLRAQMPTLLAAGTSAVVDWSDGTALGVHEQAQKGYSYVGASVTDGRLTVAEFNRFIALVEKYGKDEIRFDHSQNIILPWIETKNIQAVTADPVFKKHSYLANQISDFGTVCTGATYCNFANTFTKETFGPLVNQLDHKFPNFINPPHITMTGCPNGCAHRSIADIGLEGTRGKIGAGDHVEAFKVSIGGTLLHDGHFNEVLKGKVTKAQLGAMLSVFVKDYGANRHDKEIFFDYFKRQELPYFQALLDQFLASLDPQEAIQ